MNDKKLTGWAAAFRLNEIPVLVMVQAATKAGAMDLLECAGIHAYSSEWVRKAVVIPAESQPSGLLDWEDVRLEEFAEVQAEGG